MSKNDPICLIETARFSRRLAKEVNRRIALQLVDLLADNPTK